MDWGMYRWDGKTARRASWPTAPGRGDLNVPADGRFGCAFCRGTGKSRGLDSKCRVCHGEGRVEVDPPAMRCAYCGGLGMMGGRSSNLTCTVCRGKGIVSIRDLEDPIATCPRCGGAARHPENKLPCTTCRGRGIIAGG